VSYDNASNWEGIEHQYQPTKRLAIAEKRGTIPIAF